VHSTLPRNKRLFVLSEDGRSRISLLQSKYSQQFFENWQTKLRWVDEQKLHLTWFFLGEVRQDLTESISKKLETAILTNKSCSVRYDRLQLWPSPRQPRLLVAVASSVPDNIDGTVTALRAVLNPYVEKKESRPFRPHISLARFERNFQPEQALSLPGSLADDDLLPLDQDLAEISLIESQMGVPGVPYVPIKTFRLSE
jgi:RNA 2',3'-cyclic 3'-phosphodiesterase